MVTLAIGVLVLYNTSQRRILKEVEDAHLKEIEYKNNLLANSIEVQERERARIAKDLHDDIGSKLSIVNLNMFYKIITKQFVGQLASKVKKVLVCPDKFKFSLTSSEVSTIIKDSLPPSVECKILTLADGG